MYSLKVHRIVNDCWDFLLKKSDFATKQLALQHYMIYYMLWEYFLATETTVGSGQEII